jgi:hypothetical protein
VLTAEQLHHLIRAFQTLAEDKDQGHTARTGVFGIYKTALHSNIHSFFRLQSVAEVSKLYYATRNWFPGKANDESWSRFEDALKLRAGQWFWAAVNHPAFLRVVWKRMLNTVELWEPADPR